MQRRQFAARLSAAALGLAAPVLRAQTAASLPPVRLGTIGVSFHAVAAAVVGQTLKSLGHGVVISTAAHDEMFARLGRDEVDLLVAAWMPGTHAHLSAPIADRIQPLATLYRDARLYWTVPDYVPASAVSSAADLAKPEVAARMQRTIRSIGPSSGLSQRSLRMLPAYGLDAAGYQVVPGEVALWLGDFRDAYAAGRWCVMPLWQPHFLNRTHRLRILADPAGVMGGADDAQAIATRRFAATLPLRTREVLARMQLGLEAVTEMDLMVNVEGLSPAAAAQAWLARNAALRAQWLAA